jgi:beta-barrel assembly-enhancing protease
MFVGSGMPPTGKSADFLPLTLLSWRREDEWDADYFGVQYLYQAGYEPECFLLALQRAWADDEAARVSVATAFRPVPPLPDRLKAVQKEIAELLPVRTGAVVSTPEFEAFREHLGTLKPKAAPKESDTRKPPTLLREGSLSPQ